MQDFYIESNNESKKFELKSGWNKIATLGNTLYYKTQKHELIKRTGFDILIIGDFWNETPLKNETFDCTDFELVIKTLKGNFYYFVINDISIRVISGFLNLCPVFYSAKYKLATSSFELLKEYEGSFQISERYILETFLFNYSFFNSTIIKEIELLPAHNYLNIDNNKIEVTQFWDETLLFVNSPSAKKEDHGALVSHFCEVISDQVPFKKATISFTSGFDGRTIISAAIHLKKQFTTFSFGKVQNDDVYVPMANAKALGLSFKHVDANDEEYIKNEYTSNAIEMAVQSGGFNGFLYPHFLYMAKDASKNADTLVTGYGGSELLRATHLMGAITSKALYDVITTDDRKALKDLLLSNPSLQFLSPNMVNKNIDHLVDELMEYKKSLSQQNTLNKKMYSFLLSQTMRKVFGAWLSTQARYIKVRAPFFDYGFIKKAFATDLAGVYNSFYTKNPVKRFKGQLLYALIINRTNSVIAGQLTGKGYRPKDLLSFFGKLKIVYPFITKRLKRRVVADNLDNLSIVSGIKQYISNNKVIVNEDLFNKKKISEVIDGLNEFTPEKTRDGLLNYFSISTVINEFQKNNSLNRL